MYGKKRIEKKIIFGAGFCTVFVLCFTSVASSVVTSPSCIPDVWIGETILEWDNSIFASGRPECYTEKKSINLSAFNSEVEICVGLECSMFFRREMIFPRIGVFEIILHLDNPNGKIIGHSKLTLRGTDGEDSGVVTAGGEFDTYKNERRLIYCEVTITPYIEIVGLRPDVPLFRIHWGSQVTSYSIIECIITH